MVQANPKTIRALDIGFGFTKFTAGVDANGNATALAFPSYAIPDLEKKGWEGDPKHFNLMPVQVDTNHFFVGTESLLAAPGNAQQMLESSFYQSAEYLALARGAMAQMKTGSEIDLLVVGLPMQFLRTPTLTALLTMKLQAQHTVPVSRSSPSREILVHKVRVLPQLIGSLSMHMATTTRRDHDLDNKTLVVDVGYGTLLWITTAAHRPIPGRSGGNMGGVSAILQRLLSQIAPGYASNATILSRLDRALREGRSELQVGQEMVNLDIHLPKIQTIVASYVTELLRSIGSKGDISTVILTGGGANFYLDNLRSHFSRFFPIRNLQTF